MGQTTNLNIDQPTQNRQQLEPTSFWADAGS